VIDPGEESENTFGLMGVNPESASNTIDRSALGSNEIDEDDLQYEKCNEHRVQARRGIMIDLTEESENTSGSMPQFRIRFT
jgi:hypothetical protein